MEQNLTIWLFPVVGIVVGLVIGYLLGRNGASGGSHKEMDELQERFANYQSEVITHFNTTASLLNKLATTQQDIQFHLSEGADRLALDAQSRERLLSAMQEGGAPSRERLSAPQATEAPKDYAPKDPNAPGTLHEEFGLKGH